MKVTPLEEMEWALEHCIAYFQNFKPKGCGIEDNRACSPYNEALIALENYKKSMKPKRGAK